MNIKQWKVERKNKNETIKTTILSELFPLTELQQAYFIGRQPGVSLGNCVTHLYTELECTYYDEERFLNTLLYIFNKHDIFRTQFTDDCLQYIIGEIDSFSIPHWDISQLTEYEKQEYIVNKREHMKKIILDHRKAPLAKFEVTITSEHHAIIHFYLDALITDGWSYEIFLSELDEIYSNDISVKDKLDISFHDFVQYQLQEKKSEKYTESKNYWMNKIKGLPGIPELPLIADPCTVDASNSSKVVRAMPKNLWIHFEDNARSVALSPFIIMFTAFIKSIARYSKNQSFLLNVPVSIRSQINEDVNNLIGECSRFILFDFINIPNEPMIETARRVQEQFWELVDYCSFTGTEVVRELSKASGMMGSGIVPVVFTSTLGATVNKKHNFQKRFVETRTSQVWIDAIVFDFPDEILFSWDYVTDLFEKKTMQNMIDTYYNLLENFALDASSWDSIRTLKLMEEDLNTINKYQNTFVERKNMSLVKMLELSFEKFSDNVAIDGDDKLSYYQFKKAINNVIDIIRSNDIPTKSMIAVIMGKGWKQLAVVLGIIAAGCIYVPIDLSYPKKQINQCIEACNIPLAFIDSDFKLFEEYVSKIIVVDPESINWNESKYNKWISSSDNVICIIHTSGSTGMPKGIKIHEKGLINSLIYTIERFKISEKDKSIAVTNLCHDMSFFDFIGLLLCGGAVVMPKERYAKEPIYWARLIKEYRVTIWNSVPALLELLLEVIDDSDIKKMQSLRLIMQGGAVMKIKNAKKILALFPNVRLMNVGGPAEATLWSIMHEVTQNDLKDNCIPYGIPISNMRYYILNDNNELCPPGTKGIMFIAGCGVSDGYVNNESETSLRFVRGLFNEEIMFCTGDLGTISQNGEVVFAGRNDNQLKINGKRIELDGIENILSQVPDIDNVVIKLSVNGKYLQAYYVSNYDLNENMLMNYLEEYLPKFMIPALFKRVDSIPLNYTGKPNRSELKDIEIVSNNSFEDQDDIAKYLVNTCKEILNLPCVSIQDNFFILGGNSVQAIKILMKLKDKFKVDITLNDIFMSPYINDWYELIKSKIKCVDDSHSKQIKSIYYDKDIKLSFAQESIWTSQLLGNKKGNVLVSNISIKGNLDVDLLTKVILKVIDKHVILKTSVTENDVILKQRIRSEVNLKINKTLIDDYELKKVIKNKQRIQFGFNEVLHDIELIQVNSGEGLGYDLIITLHHIIADEETFVILYNEIISGYYNLLTGNEEKYFIDYDYFNYINKQYRSFERKDYIHYWEEKLSNIHYTNPFNCNKDTKENSDSCVYKNFINEENINILQDKCAALNATLYMGLTMVFGLALIEFSKEDSIYIGAPISNRYLCSYNNNCGLYTNMSLICVEKKSNSLEKELKAVKEETLQTMKYSIVPYETVVRQLKISRDYLQVPFHININYLASKRNSRNIEDIEFGPLEYVKGSSSHNLGLLIEHINGHFECNLTYRQDYISDKQIGVLKSYIVDLIANL